MIKYTCEDDSPEFRVSVEGTSDQLAYQIWMLIDDVSDQIQKYCPEDAEQLLTILIEQISRKMQANKEAK